MDDTRSLTGAENLIQSVTLPASDLRPVWSVDLAIAQWLNAKKKRTQSARTVDAYAKTL